MAASAAVASDPGAAPLGTYPHSGTGVPLLSGVMSTAASPSSEIDPSDAIGTIGDPRLLLLAHVHRALRPCRR